jgi:predicted nuclease with TOPRIM domain
MTTNLDQRVTQLEADMEATQASLRQLAESQVRSDERLNSFIYEVQRLLSNHGGRLERIESGLETLVATAQRHDRNAEADRAESRAFRLEMQSMTSRLDALVHYLMRQNG